MVTIDNEYKTDNNTVLAFSNDGVYWAYLIVDKGQTLYKEVFRIRR